MAASSSRISTRAALIDPAIAWLLNGSASADKGTVQIQTPKRDESIDFGAVQGSATTNVNGDGSVSTVVKEDIADIGLKASGVGENDAPINFSGRADKALISCRPRRLQEPQGVRPLGPRGRPPGLAPTLLTTRRS